MKPSRRARPRSSHAQGKCAIGAACVCGIASMLTTTTSYAFVPAAPSVHSHIHRPFCSFSRPAVTRAPQGMTRRNPSMEADLPGRFSVDSATKLLSEAVASAQSQLQRLPLPGGKQMQSSGPSPDSMLDLHLHDVPAAIDGFASRLSSEAASVGNSEWGSKITKAVVRAAAELPVSPDKLDRLNARMVEASSEAAARLSQSLDALVASNPALGPPAGRIEASLTHALAAFNEAYAAGSMLVPEEYHPLVVTLALGTVSTALGMSLAAARERSALAMEVRNLPLPREYDLPAIMNYYNRRPAVLLSRLVEVAGRLGSLGIKLWLDKKIGDGSGWEKNMDSRAVEFLDFVQGAGPAFIKIGQGVSIRPDILPPPYLRELAKLQDRVTPFDSAEARAILTKQLGKPLREVFLDADTAFEVPVAAASLGQVYRATLVSGERVAVKVQRPDVLESVTLDLYVIRILLIFISKSNGAKDSALSILGVIDNWANRFLQELDYLQEARNGDRFRAEMAASKTLGEAIVVPQVYGSLTTRYVLVTEWIEGVKVDAIDSTTPEGRERLKKVVATLLNSYLAQLLESGFLHADPHPGNFLCTPDGRLCVLDMGLMTEVAEDQRYALLEYVSHLIAKDYEATLNDLIILGFIPKEIGADPAKAAVVAPLLATVLEQLSNGGGAKSVTVESVGEEVEELGRQYPIVIPSYFGLIIRAFSALEGLGLQLDPQYSIVNECFPYLARRLLTEDSNRMRKMLRTFLYGREDRYLQVDRVDDLVEGYVQFTALADEASRGVTVAGVKDPLGRRTASGYPSSHVTAPVSAADRPFRAREAPAAPSAHAPAEPIAPSATSAGALFGGAGAGARRIPAFAAAAPQPGADATGAGGDGRRRSVDLVQDPVARDALKLLFSKEGNYVQELVVEELVRMTDALSREANLQLIRSLRTLTEAPLSPARIAKALAEAPLNPLLAPVQVPVKAQTFALSRIFNRLEVAYELNEEDQESLKALRRLQQLLGGGVNGERAGKAQSSPLGLPSPVPALLTSLSLGSVTRPQEAVDAVRQAAGLATLIGPGLLAIARKFLVQLTARSLDRLADSLDDQPEPMTSGGQASNMAGRGRFYANDDMP